MHYMEENYKRFRKRIEDAYLAERYFSPEVCRNIAFHMTDWLDDYEELGQVFDASAKLSKKRIQEIIMRFLIHASDHIAAAKKLADLGPM